MLDLAAPQGIPLIVRHMNQKCVEPPIIPLAVEKENREGCKEEQQIDMVTPFSMDIPKMFSVEEPEGTQG